MDWAGMLPMAPLLWWACGRRAPGTSRMDSPPSSSQRRVARQRAVRELAAGDLHRREDGGDRSAGKHRLDRDPRGEADLLAREHVGCDDVAGDLRLLESRDGEVSSEERAQPVRSEQVRALADEAEEAAHQTEREDVTAAQAAPDSGEALHARAVRPTREEGAVDRTHRGAHHQVGSDAALDERLQHSHLDSTEAAATREHESRAWLSHTGIDYPNLRRLPTVTRKK